MPDEPPVQPNSDESPAPELNTARMSGGDDGVWQPPSIEEAAALFPQYEILGLLGRGGMGAVYQARQLALDRLVAIKLLPLEVSADRDFADRFVREARTMGRLNHPNIIAVYEFGQTLEGHFFFAMEFVEGTNLHQIIHGPGLEPAQVLSIIGEVCDALAYAHGKGVVHRDIKPANVMLNTEGRVKVADFGLARLTDPSVEQFGHTQTGMVMGTPDYMAPEQKRGMNVDHRADIYSLGVMLYEMLCKETPQGIFDPPSHRVPVDARVDQVVIKAMQQTPERRFQSSTEMKAMVDQIRTMPAPKPRPSGPAPQSTAPKTNDRTMLYIGGGVAVLVVLLIAVFAFSGRKEKRKTVVVARPTSAAVPEKPSATPAPKPVVAATSAPVATPAPAAPESSVKQTLDLIAALDLARDRVAASNYTKANNWSKADGKLTYTSDGRSGKVMAPVSLGGVREYSIEVDFRPLGAASTFTLDLPVSASTQSGLDLHPGVKIELGLAGGQRQKIGDWPKEKTGGGRLLVLVKFAANHRDGSVTVWLDGQQIAQWSGALADMGKAFEPHPAFPGEQTPGLFSNRESYEFSSWTLRVFDGEAKVLTGVVAPPASPISVAAAPVGSRSIFDGKSFAGWHGYAETGAPTGWRIDNGLLIGQGRRKTLVSDELFGDFELSVEWRVGSGGNGGILYLIGSPESGDRVIECPEMNLMDDALSPKNKTGALFNVQEPTKAAAKPVGEWNTARLVYRSGKAEHWVNDQLVCAYELATTKFSAKLGSRGRIGLQGWTGEIAYRNVVLRLLDATDAAPAPAPPAAQSVTGKWLAEQVPQWEAAFAKEITAPFEKSVGDLRKQYLAALDSLLATATRTGKLDDAVIFRADRERMAGGGEVPAEDEALAPAALRTLRASYRTTFAKLDAERFTKAKGVHARYDAILAQNQTALTQRQRLDEALELKTQRDALNAAWLKPPAAASASTATAPAATPAPAPPKPALGQTTTPPPSKTPKLKPRELIEHLLAMGASITGAVPGSPHTTVEKMVQFPGDGFVIDKVIFSKPREGLTEADLDVLQQIDSIADLHLTGLPATDVTIERLRRLPKLRSLTLRPPNNLTAAGFRALAELPALQSLDVNIPITTECLAALGKARRLSHLLVFGNYGMGFTEEDFAAIASIPALARLNIVAGQSPPPAAWARLSSAKNLVELSLGQMPASPAMIVEISKLSGLDSLTLGNITLPDAAVAPLGALRSLRSLRTGKLSTLDGSVFATWPLRPAMRSLSFESRRSVSDDVLRAIATAFPKLERLDVTAESGSVTEAGFAHLTKLKQLSYVGVTGDALDDACLAQLTKCELLYYLGLGKARVTEAGVQSLPKLSALRQLNWINPPVTDAALKSYGKLRALADFRIGPETTPEIEQKLKAALPKVKVVR